MRKLFFLLMIMVLPLGFTACGSDDDEEQKETWGQDMNPIEGTWEREDSNRKYIFTADFKITEYRWDKVFQIWVESYTTDYQTNENSFKAYNIYDYRLEGNDILHIKSRAPGEKWLKYNRVTE